MTLADLTSALVSGAPSPRRAPPWCAGSRAGRTRWPSWSWPPWPTVGSRPYTWTTGCAPGRRPSPRWWPPPPDRFGAAFRSLRVEVGEGPNLEARARDARHRALGPEAATGHTADDQAETVLVNLLRGAGVNGLAAMRAGPRHPLLALRRSETVDLCQRAGLTPVHDPSNEDPRFVRSRVRHELIPLCSAIAGRDVVPVLARQADAPGRRRRHPRRGGVADRPGRRAPWPRRHRPSAVGRCGTGWPAHGPYPPPLDAVERVLAVARQERRATETPGGQRVSRSGDG